MLGEMRGLELVGPRHLAGDRRQGAGEELGQGRLPVAVRAEERDAVVGVDAQREPPQHRTARLITDRHVVERNDRRRQRLFGRWDRDRARLVLDAHVAWLPFCHPLYTPFPLARLLALSPPPFPYN